MLGMRQVGKYSCVLRHTQVVSGDEITCVAGCSLPALVLFSLLLLLLSSGITKFVLLRVDLLNELFACV